MSTDSYPNNECVLFRRGSWRKLHEDLSHRRPACGRRLARLLVPENRDGRGIIGWSEYNESYGSKGLTAVIMKLAETLIGQDPRPVERITANLYARTRQAPGGLIQQAIAAIENALVDVKAKALGVPVCEMLGGPVRDRLRLYWSHCGTYRLHHAEKMGLPPIRTLDDIRKLGEHVRERGFTALKTNIFLFDGASPELYMPGFGRSPGGPELNPSLRVEEALDKQLAALP